jgi:hypothetical protein
VRAIAVADMIAALRYVLGSTGVMLGIASLCMISDGRTAVGGAYTTRRWGRRARTGAALAEVHQYEEGERMKDEYDFSKAERGKFYREGARLMPPVHLEPDVLDYLTKRASARGSFAE